MTLWTVVALSVAVELFEAAWQRADTLRGVIANGWQYYRRSVFLFLLMHTGYLYTLYLSLRFDVLSWPIVGMLVFKSLDIFFKIDLIGRLHGKRDALPADMAAILDDPIPQWYFLAGALTYPWFVYMALTPY